MGNVDQCVQLRPNGDLLHVEHDVDLAIQDLEERAAILRDLIEQEEIMCEEYRRLSEDTRGHLLGARDQVASFWMKFMEA